MCQVIAENDVQDAARKIKLVQLDAIAADVEREREVVRRAVNFNFSDELLQSYAEAVRDSPVKLEEAKSLVQRK